jgi:hypothetical protein
MNEDAVKEVTTCKKKRKDNGNRMGEKHNWIMIQYCLREEK